MRLRRNTGRLFLTPGMPEPRHKTVDSLGLPIHCLEWGEPNGDPLVLVHGFLDLAFSWTSLVAELQRRAARPLWIIAPDCRGHGDSGWVSAGSYYHFPDYVLDLDSVVQTFGIETFNLTGQSMIEVVNRWLVVSYIARTARALPLTPLGCLDAPCDRHDQ